MNNRLILFAAAGVLLFMAKPAFAVQIESGQSLQGTISTSGEIDSYTFTAVVGDTVQVRMGYGGGGADALRGAA